MGIEYRTVLRSTRVRGAKVRVQCGRQRCVSHACVRLVESCPHSPSADAVRLIAEHLLVLKLGADEADKKL